MARHPQPTALAQALHADALVIAADLTRALTVINESLGGYPDHTPGAAPTVAVGATECRRHDCTNTRPCPDHDDPIRLTTTEAGALTRDPAQADHTRLLDAIRIAHHHATIAARIVTRWAHPTVDGTTVAKRIAAGGHEVWCRNCSRWGHKNPRLDGRSECAYCRDFRLEYGIDATAEIHAARDARGGILPSQHVVRILDRDVPGWRKVRKAG